MRRVASRLDVFSDPPRRQSKHAAIVDAISAKLEAKKEELSRKALPKIGPFPLFFLLSSEEIALACVVARPPGAGALSLALPCLFFGSSLAFLPPPLSPCSNPSVALRARAAPQVVPKNPENEQTKKKGD